MRALLLHKGTLVIGILLVSAALTISFGSPVAAAVSILVAVGGLVVGLVTQGLLNRRYVGRFRLALPRRRSYVVPADLPPPPGLLVGRDRDLAAICRLLGGDRSSGQPPVVVITGGEGVGKTALAVTAAHIVAPSFKDGQILVRFDTQRVDGDEYARTYLTRALKAASDPEPSDEDFDRWYRRQTAHQHILVVLDNVADSVDVARFLPSGRHCASIVTSRSPVQDVRATQSVTLGPLDDPAAMELFHTLLGDRTDEVEPRYAEMIVAAADGYPAALQMAGAVVRARRSWDLEVAFRDAEMIQLAPAGKDAPAFVDVLNLACALLTEQERSCLALLSLLVQRRVAPWMLVALAHGAFPGWTDFGEVESARILDRLARVRFAEVRVDERSGVTVYRVPSYVNAYARLLLGSEVDAAGVARATASFGRTRQARLKRTPELRAQLHVYRLLDAGRLDEALEAAREALDLAHGRRRAAAEQSGVEADAASGDERLAEVALAEVFAELGWIDDALTYSLAAERSVEALTTVRAQRVQGRIRWRLRQSAAALDKLLAARTAAESVAERDTAEYVRILRELTVAYALSPDRAPALVCGKEAVRLCAENPESEARWLPSVLWAYGFALTANGRFEEAGRVLGEADTLSGREELNQGLWRPWIRHQRAFLALQRHQFDAARGLASSALDGFTMLIHRYGAGHCRQIIGRAYLYEKNYDRAVPALEEALQTFERCGDRWVEADAAYWLGLAYAGTRGRADDATSMLVTALATFETLKDHHSASRTQKALRELEVREGRRLALLSRRTVLDLQDLPGVPV